MHSPHLKVLSEIINMKFLHISLVVLCFVKLSLQGGFYGGSGRSYNQPAHTQLITGTESQLSNNGGANSNSGSHLGVGSNDQFNPHTSHGKKFLARVNELPNKYLLLQVDLSTKITTIITIRMVKVLTSVVVMEGMLWDIMEVSKKSSGLEMFH